MNKKCKCKSTGECVFEGVFNAENCDLKKLDDELEIERLESEKNPPNLGKDIMILLEGKESNKNKIESVKMLIKLYDLIEKQKENETKKENTIITKNVRLIKSEQITSFNIIKDILDSLKPTEEYINTLEENSYEYENMCEKVQLYLNEIEDALVGKQEYNMHNLARLDSRLYAYWRYLGNKLTFSNLVKELKSISDELLLE